MAEKYNAFRSDTARPRVSDELWNILAPVKEIEGHDRLSFEYSLTRPREELDSACFNTKMMLQQYLFQLADPLDSAEIVQQIVGIADPPKIHKERGSGSTERAFCQISGDQRLDLAQWMAFEAPDFKPKFRQMRAASL